MSAFRNFIMTFFLSVLIFGLLVVCLVKYAGHAFSTAPDNRPEEVTGTDTDDGPGEETGTGEKDPLSGGKRESFSILFAVSDYRPDTYKDYNVSGKETDDNGFPKKARQILTPIILLARIEKSTGQCIITYIPSGTKVTVNGLVSPISEVFAKKGIEELKNKVMALTGLQINYYAYTDYNGYRKVIDAFGSCTFTVDNTIRYTDSTGKEVTIKKGSQTLNADQAISILFHDEYNDGGVTLAKRNLKFARELAKRVIVEDQKRNAQVLYAQFSDIITTNFTADDLVRNIDLIFSFPKMMVEEYPYPGQTSVINGRNYFVPNTAKAMEYYNQFRYTGE